MRGLIVKTTRCAVADCSTVARVVGPDTQSTYLNLQMLKYTIMSFIDETYIHSGSLVLFLFDCFLLSTWANYMVETNHSRIKQQRNQIKAKTRTL